MKGLIIDARFLFSSGIGVYLRMVLPKVISEISPKKVIVYCHSSDVKWFEMLGATNLEVRPLDLPFYSLSEQFFWLTKIFAHRGWVFWSPQYNAPLLHWGPLIATIYDLGHLSLPIYQKSLVKTVYARLLFSNVTKKAQKLFCISEFTADELIEWTEVPKQKVSVIHLAIDGSRFKTIAKPSLQVDGDYAFFVGNIKLHKNLEKLIAAFAIIQSKVKLQLVIAGQNNGFITGGDDICKIAQSAGVKLHFTGFISDAELAYYYANASLFVFPSKYEGFGLPPLEAMTMGCPVVASNSASIPEVCGDAAMYFNPDNVQEMADLILKVHADGELRKNLITKGKQRLELFKLEKLQKLTATEINAVVSGSNK